MFFAEGIYGFLGIIGQLALVFHFERHRENRGSVEDYLKFNIHCAPLVAQGVSINARLDDVFHSLFVDPEKTTDLNGYIKRIDRVTLKASWNWPA